MRLQLHKGFTFADATNLIPYFVRLGISHVYSSPILTARAGSIHGYDVVDPTTVNLEIGGEDQFRSFVASLRRADLGLIVDIVPNHMAVDGSDNMWWADLLRYGRGSRYAAYFDVDWETPDPDLRGKVLAPFLGRPYGEALEAGEIQLQLSASGEPLIRYFGTEYPIDPADYADICKRGPESFNAKSPEGRSNLHALLERQHYRLAWWRAAGDEINWRRFFDINALAGLRIEVAEVFEATHAKLFSLYAEGLIDGFRVDHVDGLADPPEYCRRLRQRLQELAPNRQAYIIIEKILGSGEKLPTDWGVYGTSGYDFMNEVNKLHHDSNSALALSEIWHELTGRPRDFEPEEVTARVETLELGFDAQLQSLTRALHDVARSDTKTRDVSAAAIRRGLVALLSHFPVYRGYSAGARRSPSDDVPFQKALAAARAQAPTALYPALNCLERWLGGEPGAQSANTRFQQLSAPVAAKAVEDTAFYRYGRLLSRNDVGFDVNNLGQSTSDFHDAMLERAATFPHAMLATATHDHKRGEDLRARLAVISEMPNEWRSFLNDSVTHDPMRPDPADQIMLYQMIVGAWPLDLDASDAIGCRNLADRLAGWQEKALREAKLRTSWTVPNEEYENTARAFLFEQMKSGSEFLKRASVFRQAIERAGAINGLSQTILKTTGPGVPDFFQGTEFWDFSLVDPDNRRPVDYNARRDALDEPFQFSLDDGGWRDGKIKQAVIQKILALRQQIPRLFSDGDYIPLEVRGPLVNNIVTFARMTLNKAIIVIVPRSVSQLLANDNGIRLELGKLSGSLVELPEQLRELHFKSIFSEAGLLLDRESLPLETLLGSLPFAVLVSVESP